MLERIRCMPEWGSRRHSRVDPTRAHEWFSHFGTARAGTFPEARVLTDCRDVGGDGLGDLTKAPDTWPASLRSIATERRWPPRFRPPIDRALRVVRSAESPGSCRDEGQMDVAVARDRAGTAVAATPARHLGVLPLAGDSPGSPPGPDRAGRPVLGEPRLGHLGDLRREPAPSGSGAC